VSESGRDCLPGIDSLVIRAAGCQQGMVELITVKGRKNIGGTCDWGKGTGKWCALFLQESFDFES